VECDRFGEDIRSAIIFWECGDCDRFDNEDFGGAIAFWMWEVRSFLGGCEMRSLVGNVEKCDRFWRCRGAIVFWGVGRRSFFENEGFGGAIVFGVVGMRSLFWDVEARSLCRMRREGAIVPSKFPSDDQL
jgi:hypothetical protein